MKTTVCYRLLAGSAIAAATIGVATPAHADTTPDPWSITSHAAVTMPPAVGPSPAPTAAPGPDNPQARPDFSTDRAATPSPAPSQARAGASAPPPRAATATRTAARVAGHRHRARHPQPTATRTWLVGPGDTLSLVAAVYGVTVERIAARNGITDPDLIRVGQLLTVPVAGR